MKFVKIFSLILILSIFCSINVIAAVDLTNSSLDDISLNEPADLDSNLNNEIEIVSDNNNFVLSTNEDIGIQLGTNEGFDEDEGYVIYVGHNNKTETGNGSYENPFSNFQLACDNVSNQEKVTLKIFDGTYYLGGNFKFDTPNLNIKGYNGSVIIKNQYNAYGHTESFGSTSSIVNFTFSNLIFDASNHTMQTVIMGYPQYDTWFFPFYGSANLGVFNNCSFISYGDSNKITGSEYNSKFIMCYFDFPYTYDDHYLFYNNFARNTNHTFEYCRFNYDLKVLQTIYLPCNILFDNVWFGKNEVPSYIHPRVINPDLSYNNTWSIPVSRYANFTVTQNYLDNNQFEIIGKLTWNGTEDQDGMENFQPMTVTLTSNTGIIDSTAILKNGEFRAIYTSTNSTHKITVTLDNEEKELEFNNVNISVIAPGINYGDEQNVTITFTQPITANITVTVSNESYRKNYTVEVINKDSIIYTIQDTLKAGTYTIDVNLADKGLYGSNSTELKISKVVIDNFNPVLPGENPKVGDNVTITVELPDGATGNVIVYVNNNPFTKEASTNTEITINGLVAGENKVKVIYSGNDKYENASFEGIITAEKVPINVTNNTIVIDSPTNSNTPSVSINLTSDATGNLTVTVKGKNYTQELVNGSATVTITDLASGTYDAVVTYSGDDKYDPITKNVTLTVNTIKTSIVAPSVTTTYNVAKKLVVTLKDANGKALSGKKVTVKVGSISKTLTTNGNGQVSVDIFSLVPKTYSATIKFAGDEKYAQSTATAKVVVNKVKSKITAKKATFKAKKKTKKYTITLKAGKKAISKVKVTLKVKGKTYKATTNAKGKATFKITKLTKKGKHNAVIKFKGNKFYKASSKKVKLTIKK